VLMLKLFVALCHFGVQAEGEDQPLAFVSVVDLQGHQGLETVQQLKKIFAGQGGRENQNAIGCVVKRRARSCGSNYSRAVGELAD